VNADKDPTSIFARRVFFACLSWRRTEQLFAREVISEPHFELPHAFSSATIGITGSALVSDRLEGEGSTLALQGVDPCPPSSYPHYPMPFQSPSSESNNCPQTPLLARQVRSKFKGVEIANAHSRATEVEG
jgi:hypothetical protein